MLCKALVLLVCFCFYSSFVLADTPAPSYPTTTTPDTIDLDDGTITSPSGGCPSGTSIAYVYGSGSTIRFGECINTFAVTYAINQALQGSGVSIDKAHYSWKYIHCFNKPGSAFCMSNIEDRVNTNTGEVTDDTYWDELVVVVEITDSNGNVVETKTWTMDTWYQWNSSNAHSSTEVLEGSAYWQIHTDNIEIFNHNVNSGTIRTPNAVGDVRFRITGYDKGNWDGYYGPIVKDLKTWFTYRANPCAQTALYDVSCPGYAEAYATYQYNTNCSANALYDSGCPGYATAYYNQQCTASPLYDSGCNGYAAAYYTQQCTADPLYDSGCDGYANAYYNQQCGISALYDSGCYGYETAYYNYQCSASALYDSGCTGYAEAYLAQQCGISALYNSSCTGYAAAYLTQQCDINTLYNSACTGYAEAYLLQQCTADALYDASCTGHFEAQCDVNTLYDFQCTGYSEAYFNQQCLYNPQYDSLCQGYQAPVVDVPEVGDIGIPGTGDSIIDNIISLPPARMPDIIILPQPAAPEPEPIEIEVEPVEIIVIATDVPVIAAPIPEAPVLETDLAPEVLQIEREVEAQIELELSIDVEPEPEMEISNEAQEEEPSSDVEQSMDSDGTDEDSSDSGQSDEDSSSEDTEGDTTEEVEEETTEEETTEEATDEETNNEEVDESTDEESTEENTEEESSEEEAVEEETTEEVVVKKKVTKKKVLTKAQKKKAKEKKMREIIKDKLNKLAEDMGKAQSLEDQQALQQIIAALINYVPGFNTYGQFAIPGVDFYNQDEIYKDKKVPENLRGLRNGLASELLHKKMVDMQYEGMD